MSAPGDGITTALRSTADFFESLANLLQSAAAQMAPAGWKPLNNTALYGGSASILNPRQWLPQDAFRLMALAGNTDLLAFISVLLDDYNDPAAVPQPLLSAGWLDFSPGAFDTRYVNTFSRIFLALDDQRADGVLRPAAPERIDRGQRHGMSQAWVLALPLVEISSAEVLEQRVVSPLLEGLKKTR